MTSPRQKGLNFERKVRTDLENKGWNVSKFMNNVDLDFKTDIIRVDLSKGNNKDIIGEALSCTDGKMITAKGGRFRLVSTGFPDFIAFKPINCSLCQARGYKVGSGYDIIGVEVKSNGYLSKEEKQKCQWYLDNKIFSRIHIVKKGKKRGEIIYTDFNDYQMKGGT